MCPNHARHSSVCHLRARVFHSTRAVTILSVVSLWQPYKRKHRVIKCTLGVPRKTKQIRIFSVSLAFKTPPPKSRHLNFRLFSLFSSDTGATINCTDIGCVLHTESALAFLASISPASREIMQRGMLRQIF